MKAGGGDGRLDGERCNLSEGVDACVGATGALGEYGFSGDVEDGFGERSLHGWKAGLYLPSVKRCPIVGEDCLPKRHTDVIGR